MAKGKVVLFTKTNWAEPPRLRHQVAELLSNMGYEVIFFEQASLKLWFKTRKIDKILFVQHFELLHHRLRFSKVLIKLNAMVSKFFIRKAIKSLQLQNAHIINFNYDYYFLGELFSNGFVTIINDDFVNKIKNRALRSNTEYQLSQTCKNSIMNFAVSYPLEGQLKKFTDKVDLLFPWAERKYSTPETTRPRDVALFYGYINYRLDWPLINCIIKKGVKIRFIGPIEKSVNEKYIEEIKKLPNVEIQPPQKISDVDFSDVCCSILPWDTSFEGVRAITINNKCFNLLSYGIPQVYSDLPYLIEADNRVIAKCSTADEFAANIIYFSKHFQECQKPIEEFLTEHYADKRKLQLKKYLI